MPELQTYFATCSPGLEPLLHRELQNLRMSKVERQVGGVRFSGEAGEMMKANLWLRTAGRVLLRIGRFEAHGTEALYAGAKEIPWENWLKRGATIRVDAQTKDSDLDHSRFIEQRIKDAVVDRVTELGFPRPQVEGEEADLRIHAHLYRNRVIVSLDSSGAALRKRGWRVAQGRAPLAETLAAAMVLESGWNGKAPLLDPFCGSGTLLIEAALWASNRAPGSFRESFGFESWKGFEPKPWKQIKAEEEKGRKPLGKTPLLGWDHSRERVEEAKANVESAGFAGKIEIGPSDARQMPTKPGWNAQILTNPPYGVRVGEAAQLEGLYSAFGAYLSQVGSGYEVLLLTVPELVEHLGWERPQVKEVRNGAIDCVWVRKEL